MSQKKINKDCRNIYTTVQKIGVFPAAGITYIMANDYLVSKWRLWFRGNGITHKGTISRSDIKQYGAGKTELQDSIDKLWEDFIFRGKSGPVTEQEFIDMNTLNFTANKQKFVEGMRERYTTFFDLFDARQQGFISEEEFMNIMKTGGRDNDSTNKKFFNAFNPEDGKVASTVLVDSWVQFMTCDDSMKKDVIKEAFEAGY